MPLRARFSPLSHLANLAKDWCCILRPMPPDDIEHWYAAMRKEWPLQVAGQHLTSLGT